MSDESAGKVTNTPGGQEAPSEAAQFNIVLIPERVERRLRADEHRTLRRRLVAIIAISLSTLLVTFIAYVLAEGFGTNVSKAATLTIMGAIAVSALGAGIGWLLSLLGKHRRRREVAQPIETTGANREQTSADAPDAPEQQGSTGASDA